MSPVDQLLKLNKLFQIKSFMNEVICIFPREFIVFLFLYLISISFNLNTVGIQTSSCES